MTDHPEAPPLRYRTVGHLHLGDDETTVTVEHVFLPEGADTCEDCGKPAHDPGMVGLFVGDGEDGASALLTAEEALTLANRLTRAASLVLESGEDVPDVEREAARFASHDQDQP